MSRLIDIDIPIIFIGDASDSQLKKIQVSQIQEYKNSRISLPQLAYEKVGLINLIVVEGKYYIADTEKDYLNAIFTINSLDSAEQVKCNVNYYPTIASMNKKCEYLYGLPGDKYLEAFDKKFPQTRLEPLSPLSLDKTESNQTPARVFISEMQKQNSKVEEAVLSYQMKISAPVDFLKDYIVNYGKVPDKRIPILLGHCLTGDTKIRLLDGTTPTIEELSTKYGPTHEFWVYSCKADGEVVPTPAFFSRITKEVDKLAYVHLDNDEVVKCTIDHPFMTRDGVFVEAQDLTPDTSLMPLYYKAENKEHNWMPDYPRYIDNRTGKEDFVHYLVVDKVFGGYHGANLRCYHKDFNKENNDPSNLVIMTQEEHDELHKARWDDPIFLAKMKPILSENGKRMMEKIWHSPEYEETRRIISERMSKLATEMNIKNWADPEYRTALSNKVKEQWAEYDSSIRKRLVETASIRVSARNKTLWNDPVYKAKFSEDLKRYKILKIAKKILDNGLEFNSSTYNSLRKGAVHSYEKAIDIFGTRENILIQAQTYNHKVVKVEIVECNNTPVYDITVPDYHNFALASGVFVHNTGIAKSAMVESLTNKLMDASGYGYRLVVIKAAFMDKCLTGDTEVLLLDGTSKQIKDLADDYKTEFWVYSSTIDGDVVPAKATAGLNKENANLVRVTLDNQESIRCTPNHRFMMRDGSYVEAQYLKENDSLMPLYFGESEYTQAQVVNHKVVSVEFLNETENVYDLNVPKYGNFATKAGVFVHNSDILGYTTVLEELIQGQLMEITQDSPMQALLTATDDFVRVARKTIEEMDKDTLQGDELKAYKKLAEYCKTPILFFDEVNRTNKTILMQLMVIFSEKVLGTNYRWFQAPMIAAANWPVEISDDEMKGMYSGVDDSSTDPAPIDRYYKLGVSHTDPSVLSETKDWLINKFKPSFNVEGVITSLNKKGLFYNPNVMEKEDSSSYLKFPTFRGWEYTFQYMETKLKLKETDLLSSVIEGLIGKQATNAFRAYISSSSEFKNFSVVDSIPGQDIQTSHVNENNKAGVPSLLLGRFGIAKTAKIEELSTNQGACMIRIDLSTIDRTTARGAPAHSSLAKAILGPQLENTKISENLTKNSKDDPSVPKNTTKYVPYDLLHKISDAGAKGQKIILFFDEINRTNPLNQSAVFDAISEYKCFVGSTKIKLLDGTILSLDDVYTKYKDKDFWVYSCKEDGSIIAGKAHSIKKTSLNGRRLVKITLDNGKSEICTEDHPWMMRDGSYVQASNLIPEKSLMPLYTKISSKDGGDWLNGYEEVLDNKDLTWYYTHTHLPRELELSVLDHTGGEVYKILRSKSNLLTHHRNFNKLDNSPDNMGLMSFADHRKYHGDHVLEITKTEYWKNQHKAAMRKLWDSNPEFRKISFGRNNEDSQKRRSESISQSFKVDDNRLSNLTPNNVDDYNFKCAQISKGIKDYWDSEKSSNHREIARKTGSDTFSTLWKDPIFREKMVDLASIKFSEYMNRSEVKESYRTRCINRNSDDSFQLKCKFSKGKKIYTKLVELGLEFNNDNFNSVKSDYFKTYKGATYSSFLEASNTLGVQLNHKVVSVEYVESNEDLYDFTVDGYHNFSLASGVFVHNCLGVDLLEVLAPDAKSRSEAIAKVTSMISVIGAANVGEDYTDCEKLDAATLARFSVSNKPIVDVGDYDGFLRYATKHFSQPIVTMLKNNKDLMIKKLNEPMPDDINITSVLTSYRSFESLDSSIKRFGDGFLMAFNKNVETNTLDDVTEIIKSTDWLGWKYADITNLTVDGQDTTMAGLIQSLNSTDLSTMDSKKQNDLRDTIVDYDKAIYQQNWRYGVGGALNLKDADFDRVMEDIEKLIFSSKNSDKKMTDAEIVSDLMTTVFGGSINMAENNTNIIDAISPRVVELLSIGLKASEKPIKLSVINKRLDGIVKILATYSISINKNDILSKIKSDRIGDVVVDYKVTLPTEIPLLHQKSAELLVALDADETYNITTRAFGSIGKQFAGKPNIISALISNGIIAVSAINPDKLYLFRLANKGIDINQNTWQYSDLSVLVSEFDISSYTKVIDITPISTIDKLTTTYFNGPVCLTLVQNNTTVVKMDICFYRNSDIQPQMSKAEMIDSQLELYKLTNSAKPEELLELTVGDYAAGREIYAAGILNKVGALMVSSELVTISTAINILLKRVIK